MLKKSHYVYIMTNPKNTVLYTGVTNDIPRRAGEHCAGAASGFTRRYHAAKLVYAEQFDSVESAIRREKQIKAGSRKKKLDLIQGRNAQWRDLAEDLQERA